MDKKFLFKVACALAVLTATVNSASAAEIKADINTTSADNGYVCVTTGETQKRLKLRVSQGKLEQYYDCPVEHGDIPLEFGDGLYTCTLYENVEGNHYRPLTTRLVKVKLENPDDPYLVSTAEVPYAEANAVCALTDGLCSSLSSDEGKAVRLYNYIAKYKQYDYSKAAAVTTGKIVAYNPMPDNVLAMDKGICYDFSVLYAAMCRSQGIPCKVEKGYAGENYHSWNEVRVDGKWYVVDPTYAVCQSRYHAAATIEECVSPVRYTHNNPNN